MILRKLQFDMLSLLNGSWCRASWRCLKDSHDGLDVSGMREDARSPRARSRSPISRERSPPNNRESPKEVSTRAEEEKDCKSPFDSYSASLRLASLETLTGKGGKGPGLPLNFPFPGLGVSPAASSDSTSAKVPTDMAALPLPDALANLQKTASQASGSYGVLGSLSSLSSAPSLPSLPSPFHQLLAGQGTMSVPGLPKPAELIQQAQALQLLAHLQTMLMTPTSSPATPQPRDSQHHFQKVTNALLSFRSEHFNIGPAGLKSRQNLSHNKYLAA